MELWAEETVWCCDIEGPVWILSTTVPHHPHGLNSYRAASYTASEQCRCSTFALLSCAAPSTTQVFGFSEISTFRLRVRGWISPPRILPATVCRGQGLFWSCRGLYNQQLSVVGLGLVTYLVAFQLNSQKNVKPRLSLPQNFRPSFNNFRKKKWLRSRSHLL